MGEEYELDVSELLEKYGLIEKYVLADGTVLRNVHSHLRCAGRPCVIHAPSEHHMRDMPLVWENAERSFYRVCEHGIQHPDPDDLRFKLNLPSGDDGWGVHRCDECCRPKQV